MSKDIREFRASLSQEFGPHFKCEFAETKCFGPSMVFTINGQPVAAVMLDPTALPAGFQERLAHHVMDALTGRRPDLWSEQAIYGEHPRDPEHARINGQRVAEDMERKRGQ